MTHLHKIVAKREQVALNKIMSARTKHGKLMPFSMRLAALNAAGLSSSSKLSKQ